jgi:hypothetical protein
MKFESNTIVMRPDLFGQLLFTVPFIIIAVFLAEASDFIASLSMISIAFALLCIIRSITISIMFEGIKVRKLFTEKALLWHDIYRVETKVRFSGKHGSYLTTLFSLNPTKPNIVINIKFLSKKKVFKLVQILISNCPNAQIDNQTKKIAEGHLPSIFRSVAG